MPPRLPLGYSDYRRIRESGFSLVDKTGFVGRVLAAPAQVQLYCRPRRFGKTTNLSMLRYFLEKPPEGEDRSALFVDTEVWSNESARKHFEQYPVVYLSLKDAKSTSWRGCLALLAAHIRVEIDRHGLAAEIPADEAVEADVTLSLQRLIAALNKREARRVVVLIDEYDTPLHTAWSHDFFPEAAVFFRGFFGSALKDNIHLERAVLTGILRVAQESIFSDLNNLSVNTVLDRQFSTDFGFTESDVAGLVADRPELLAGLRGWYNGYQFGTETIYNPWSIVSALSQPDSPLQPYWVSTGGTAILERLATHADPSVAAEVGRLMNGETSECTVVYGLALRGIERQSAAFFNLLLHSGYLSARTVTHSDDGATMQLVIPNREVRFAFRNTIALWVDACAGSGTLVPRLINGLLAGNLEAVESALSALLLGIVSYHDLADRTPERVYHAFVLGLLAHMPSGFRVLSNREFGDGRPDVVVFPRDDLAPAALLEFKVAGEGESADDAADRGAHQIVQRRYAVGVGRSVVHCWAVGFSGKRVGVRLVE